MSASNYSVFQKASQIKGQKLSIGSLKLDEFLCGGLLVGGITEICGESGTGKSQLCMQLALTAQYPENYGGLQGEVIYICSEEQFQSRRLYQLIENFPKRFDKKGEIQIEFSDHIYVTKIDNCLNFENLTNKILLLIQSKNIKLVILDSITAIFRGNFTNSEGLEKAREIRKIAKFFYRLCGEFNVTVVCVNQVAQTFESDELIPALGLVWANLINTRIALKKNSISRIMKIVFCPVIPSKEIEFRISNSGEKLSKLFPQSEVIVAKKADSLYPVVGAASICAKVIRDNVISHWKFLESVDFENFSDFGSGYPNDPKTKDFLHESKDDVFGFSSIVRFSWSTATKIAENLTAVKWEDEINENHSEKKVISSYFKSGNIEKSSSSKPVADSNKHKTKCFFLKDRLLQSAEHL